MSVILAVFAAYLLGSLSFAVIVSRLMGMADPRTYGSGNPGATNVLRSGRKTAAALTLLGDAAKGWLAVFLADTFRLPEWNDTVIAAVAVAVLIGHMFPVFFRFKGGKGVATAVGVLLALSPAAALVCIAVWLAMAFGLKISSLAALCAAVIAPFAVYFFAPQHAYTVAAAIIAVLVLWRHSENIRKLLQGKESKIGS